jgi:hypothetical protein
VVAGLFESTNNVIVKLMGRGDLWHVSSIYILSGVSKIGITINKEINHEEVRPSDN